MEMMLKHESKRRLYTRMSHLVTRSLNVMAIKIRFLLRKTAEVKKRHPQASPAMARIRPPRVSHSATLSSLHSGTYTKSHSVESTLSGLSIPPVTSTDEFGQTYWCRLVRWMGLPSTGWTWPRIRFSQVARAD